MSQRLLARKPADTSETAQGASSGLRMNKPGDTFEQEADRAAATITSGGRVPSWSIGRIGMGSSRNTVQRDGPDGTAPQQPDPKPNNYGDAAKKAAEAFAKTDTGKKLEAAAKDDPLVKGASDFVGTLPGKIIVGAAAAGTVTALAIEHKALPIQIPAIPLDVISPKLKDMSVKVEYDGPVDKPTKAMLTFSYTPGGDKKKKKNDSSEQIARETQALRASMDMFKPKDDSIDQVAVAEHGRFAPYAKKAAADTPLDKKLDLKPADAAPPVTDDKKKEDAAVQRKPSESAMDAGQTHAPSSVGSTLESSGTPLDRETRSFFESRFRRDFGDVRIYAGGQAASSAREIAARAYTVGDKIVFNSGQYAPHTQEGRKLLAHELTHVVQQEHAPNRAATSRLSIGAKNHSSEVEADSAARMTGSAVNVTSRQSHPVVSRAPNGWSSDYDDLQHSAQPKSFLQLPYDKFKAGLGEVKPTTQGGLTKNEGRPLKTHAGAGTPAGPDITLPILKEIYPDLAKDVDDDKTGTRAGQAQSYLDSLNQAFQVMKIDTIEARANYLAHAFVESGQFRAFTESQAGTGKPQTWIDDPTKVALNTSALPKDKDVNPHGNFEFIGRGPVQVTHRPEYVESVAMLEKTADQYDKDAAAGDTKAKASAQIAREAAKAVRDDPRQAANPKYAFLFSASLMKRRGADVTVAGQAPGKAWTGDDAASSWVAGGKQAAGTPQAQALVDKGNAYAHIYKVLMREAQKSSAPPQKGTP